MKTLLEHRDEMAPLHPALGAWTLENAVTAAEAPFHPGAVKYYREKGVWAKQLEEKEKRLWRAKR